MLNLTIINNHNLQPNSLIEIKSKLKALIIVMILLSFSVMIIVNNINEALSKDTLKGENKNMKDKNNNFIISKGSNFIIYSIKIVLFIMHFTILKLYLKLFE